jgi:adenylate cyclase
MRYREGLTALEEEATAPDRDRLELSLQILLGNALMVDRGFGSPETLPVWQRAAVLAEKLGDINELTSALNGEAVYYYDTGDSIRAARLAGRILDLAEQHDLRIAALRGHCTLALALLYTGDVLGALEHAQAAVSVYLPTDFDLVTYGVGTDQGVVAHGTASLALWWLGSPDSALVEARAGVELAEHLESALSLALARTFLAIAHHLRREPELALRVAQENIQFSEELGFPFWLGLGLLLAGAQKARLGDRGGLEDVGRGLAILGEAGSRGGAALGFAVLAEAQRCVGDLDPALATLEGGLALVSAMGERFNDGELLRMKAEVLVERDPARLPEALTILRTVLDQARERGGLTTALRAATSLVRLEGDDIQGQRRARELLLEIHGQFREGFETPDLREAAALLG